MRLSLGSAEIRDILQISISQMGGKNIIFILSASGAVLHIEKLKKA
jgi:hypothetical protein